MLKAIRLSVLTLSCLQLITHTIPVMAQEDSYVFEAGHPSLQKWLLPDVIPAPENNPLTSQSIALGKRLFFDSRLSANGTVSCATCHSPDLGWSDALPRSKGINNSILQRTSPSLINMAYNSIYMWDGRAPSLEEQVLIPVTATNEMGLDLQSLTNIVSADDDYQKSFAAAYPEVSSNQLIDTQIIAKAIASFVRTITSGNSPFDRWIKGDNDAINPQQIEGFKLFLDKDKGNCVACHHAPNFTDDGFHNLGFATIPDVEPDAGRFAIKPLKLMNGAFKTPTLRNINQTAPYFHDGRADSLEAVMDHYIDGGTPNPVISPDMKALELTKQESQMIIEFLKSLSSPNTILTPETPKLSRDPK